MTTTAMAQRYFFLVVLITVFNLPYSRSAYNFFNPVNCAARFPSLMNEVQQKENAVQAIIQAAMTGAFRGTTYGNVSDFTDTFSNRISGSDGLEESIDYLRDQMQATGFTNVRTENVLAAPAWKRGTEIAQLISPYPRELNIVGLGLSATTPIFGITSDAVVFNSYEELLANREKARNKIVICNYGGPAANPLDTIDNGYAEAVTSGARAMLYKAATTFSLASNHARRGNLYYDGKTKKVPIAYLTVEDSHYLSRLSARGKSLTIYLNMQSTNLTRTSRNLFGDLVGREKPEEVVIVSAHSDTWDQGPGVQDDAVGVYLPMQAIPLLKSLNLIPRRTIRTAIWTSEEYGYLGSQSYIQKNRGSFDRLSAAMEADYGCLLATGLIFNGNYELGCVLQQVINYLKGVSYGILLQADIFRTDLDNFQDAGIPVVSLYGDDGRYFWFHHTKADTLDAADSAVFDTCLATWASTAYILADLPEMVTRGFDPIV